jgi:hypothetical protein
MANYIVTYDLNGSTPTHKQMDDHLKTIVTNHGRILETVWWIEYSGTAEQLRDRISTILGKEDLLLVVQAASAAWTKLLVNSQSLLNAWSKAA